MIREREERREREREGSAPWVLRWKEREIQRDRRTGET